MQCQNAQDHFSDFVDGTLDSPLAVTVEHHLSECSQCRDVVAGLRRVFVELGAVQHVDTPMYFHENLMHRVNLAIDEQDSIATKRRALWNWRALLQPRAVIGVAAAIVLMYVGTSGSRHTTAAGLWPFSIFVHSTQATPVSVGKPMMGWTDSGSGKGDGTLTVRLQLDNLGSVSGPDMEYAVTVEQPAIGAAVRSMGTFLPDGTVTVKLALTTKPAPTDTLDISVSGSKGADAKAITRHESIIVD